MVGRLIRCCLRPKPLTAYNMTQVHSLKRQCHENCMTFYHRRCCLRPKPLTDYNATQVHTLKRQCHENGMAFLSCALPHVRHSSAWQKSPIFWDLNHKHTSNRQHRACFRKSPKSAISLHTTLQVSLCGSTVTWTARRGTWCTWWPAPSARSSTWARHSAALWRPSQSTSTLSTTGSPTSQPADTSPFQVGSKPCHSDSAKVLTMRSRWRQCRWLCKYCGRSPWQRERYFCLVIEHANMTMTTWTPTENWL